MNEQLIKNMVGVLKLNTSSTLLDLKDVTECLVKVDELKCCWFSAFHHANVVLNFWTCQTLGSSNRGTIKLLLGHRYTITSSIR